MGFHLADWGVGRRQVRAEPRPLLPVLPFFLGSGPVRGLFVSPGSCSLLAPPCTAVPCTSLGECPFGQRNARSWKEVSQPTCPFYRFGNSHPETGFDLSSGSKIVQGRAQTGTQVFFCFVLFFTSSPSHFDYATPFRNKACSRFLLTAASDLAVGSSQADLRSCGPILNFFSFKHVSPEGKSARVECCSY